MTHPPAIDLFDLVYDEEPLDEPLATELRQHIEGCGDCRLGLWNVAYSGIETPDSPEHNRQAYETYRATLARIGITTLLHEENP